MLMVTIVYYPGDIAAKGTAEILEREYSIKVTPIPNDSPFHDFSDIDDDVIIVLSRHKSSKEIKSFTVHHTGNIGPTNELGGKPREVSIAFPSIACSLLRSLKDAARDREDYEVAYEATHHGPTVNKAIIFIEIGSSEKQWGDPKNHYVLAKAVARYKDFGCSGIRSIWIGGPHYSSRASKRCFSDEACFGHIVAKYNVPYLDDEMLKKIVEKSMEKIERAYLEKKSMKSEQRKHVRNLLEEWGIEVVSV
ncbi:D-tyrosyl-tRNA(Tyr) deacylase [Ignicoccus pacificus DSM 13166]|uniref:D-aminoacyl-tRNA deacylase n=1 Tax=Ignicoccus pacificus DSM 13166 TaxID=940294 RepID=A0A977PKJ5_9CREN|nr:D-tyrosyl-tRNA(Tyr) deacylase [Ignicoccus pacificus DSM 13166]